MWRKKLKQKKLQYFLCGIILFCSSMIATGCLGLIFSVDHHINKYYSEACFVDEFGMMPTAQAKVLKEKLEESNKIKNVFLEHGIMATGKMESDGKDVSVYMQVVIGIDDYKKLEYGISFKDNISEIAPGTDEIWIASTYADLKQLSVGDYITFGNDEDKEFRISKIVDGHPISTSLTVGYYPMYINETRIGDFENYMPYSNFYVKGEGKVKDVEDYINEVIKENKLECIFMVSRDLLKDASASNLMLLSGIGLMAGIMIFIVSLVVIRFLIRSNIAKEFKNIGIYKAYGFRSKVIKKFYVNCYVLVGSISLFLGSLMGIPLANILANSGIKYFSDFKIGIELLPIGVLCAILLFMILIINVYFGLRQIGKISPVEALTKGNTSSKEKLKKSFIKNAHSSFAMAVNDIMKRKGLSILIIFMLTVSFSVCVFFVNMRYTTKTLEQYSGKWMGLPESDGIACGNITPEIIEFIEKNNKVEYCIYGAMKMQLISSVDNNTENNLSNSMVYAFNDYSQAKGIDYLKGRAPANSEEMGVGLAYAKLEGIKVGDYISIKVGESTKDMLVTGFFSSMNGNGNCVQLMLSTFEEADITLSNDLIMMDLKDKSQFETFKTEFETEFPNHILYKKLPQVVEQLKSIGDMMAPITTIMIVIFACFSVLNIINLTIVNQMEDRKKYGILKAYGFTNGYIIRRTFFKILILSGISMVISFILIPMVMKPFVLAILNVDGAIINMSWTILVELVVFCLVMLSTILFNLAVRKVSPIDLMEE